MTTYTADGFKAARFAKHPSGGVACKPGDDRPWICHSLKSDREFFLVDESMAELGWAPVPAGSYTRTDEDTPEQYREAWQSAEKAVLDERAMRKDAEHERDAAQAEAAMCQTSLNGQIRRAEQAEDALAEMTAHRDQCRDTAIKWQMEANRAEQARALTPDDIEQLVTQNRYRVADAIRALYPEEAMATEVLAHTVITALTEPIRPEWADLADVIREITYHPEPDYLARALHHEGVRVVTEDGAR